MFIIEQFSEASISGDEGLPPCITDAAFSALFLPSIRQHLRFFWLWLICREIDAVVQTKWERTSEIA